MSQAEAGYPVADSSREDARCACIVWCHRWVGVWGVCSFVEIRQGVNGGLFRQRVPRPAGYYKLSK